MNDVARANGPFVRGLIAGELEREKHSARTFGELSAASSERGRRYPVKMLVIRSIHRSMGRFSD